MESDYNLDVCLDAFLKQLYAGCDVVWTKNILMTENPWGWRPNFQLLKNEVVLPRKCP